jgi:hypothetical protein
VDVDLLTAMKSLSLHEEIRVDKIVDPAASKSVEQAIPARRAALLLISSILPTALFTTQAASGRMLLRSRSIFSIE